MTTIITRLYSDKAAADAVVAALLKSGHDNSTIHLIGSDAAGGAEAAIMSARVNRRSAATYAKAMTGPQTLLVVHAPFNPVGTARSAMKIVGRHPAIDVGLEDETEYLREYPGVQVSGNVLTKHPLVMSNPFRRASHGHILGSDPLIKSKPRTSAMRGGGHMSRMFWPMKLVSTGRKGTSAMSRTWTFSHMLGLPLLWRGELPRPRLPL